MISERLNRWWSKKRKWKEAKSKLKEWVYDKDMDLGIIGGGGVRTMSKVGIKSNDLVQSAIAKASYYDNMTLRDERVGRKLD